MNSIRFSLFRIPLFVQRTHLLASSCSKVNLTRQFSACQLPTLNQQKLTIGLQTQQQFRQLGHGMPMTQHNINERVMLVLRLFDKVNADKLTPEANFMKDLGLDSLDHVELIMAMEDEFGFEIPDQDAERLVRPADIVQYLCDKLDVIE